MRGGGGGGGGSNVTQEHVETKRDDREYGFKGLRSFTLQWGIIIPAVSLSPSLSLTHMHCHIEAYVVWMW